MNFNPKFLTRQLDIIPMNSLAMPIEVIGCGAIGSHTIMALARMGFGNLTIYDYDKVSDVNLNNQGFSRHEIGRMKALCMRDRVDHEVGFVINAHCAKYQPSKFKGIVIMAVDSMEARKEIWDGSNDAKLIIDPRMGAEYIKMYAMNPRDEKDRESYAKTLYTDEEAVQVRCTEKSTIYTAYLISGLIANVVKDFVTKNDYIRTLNWNIKSHAMEQFVKQRH